MAGGESGEDAQEHRGQRIGQVADAKIAEHSFARSLCRARRLFRLTQDASGFGKKCQSCRGQRYASLVAVQQFDSQPDKKGVAGWSADTTEHAGFGDAWVLMVHFTRPVQAWSVLAYGQTTDRESRHSRDQIRLFANHELRPVYFTEAEIAKNLERSPPR